MFSRSRYSTSHEIKDHYEKSHRNPPPAGANKGLPREEGEEAPSSLIPPKADIPGGMRCRGTARSPSTDMRTNKGQTKKRSSTRPKDHGATKTMVDVFLVEAFLDILLLIVTREER